MRAWSEYYQLPEFLEYTRRYMLTEEMRELVTRHMEVMDGDRILEAGCGTGYLSRYLMRGRRFLDITGIDSDEGFIEQAGKLGGAQMTGDGYQYGYGGLEKSCAFRFMTGDVRCLPFEEHSFDRVVSHTFLTSTPEPRAAMEEMVRVVRPGGTVSSITAMSLAFLVTEEGQYPADCAWLDRYRKLFVKIWNLYEKMEPTGCRVAAMDSRKIPRLFVDCGLREISLFPIGNIFSFSNASLTREERIEYVEESYQAEQRKLDRFFRLEEAKNYLTEQEAREYRMLMAQKRNYLLRHLDDNSIFEWSGAAELLVTGRKEE